MTHSDIKSNIQLSLGTILYATCVTDENSGKEKFIVDDILHYRGVNMKKMTTIDKLSAWNECFSYFEKNTPIYSPYLWNVSLQDVEEYPNTLDDKVTSYIHYPIHHIQYRSSNEVMPYINVYISKN